MDKEKDGTQAAEEKAQAELQEEIDDLDGFAPPAGEDHADEAKAVAESQAGEQPVAEGDEAAAPAAADDRDERIRKLQQELDNKTKALAEERTKRKEAQELAVKIGEGRAKPSFEGSDEFEETGSQASDAEVDEEVGRTIDKRVDPKLDEMRVDLRATNYRLSEERAKGKHADYDEVTKGFDKMIDEKPDIRNAFYGSDDPCEFAYRISIAQNFEAFLERERKKVAEETAKKFGQDLSKRRTVPSLSRMGGEGLRPPADESTLRKELDEL
jgi:hypothetical protein